VWLGKEVGVMRYSVDPAELRTAVERLARGLVGRGVGASRALGQVARGIPGGVTAAALPDLLVRWRTRERRLEAGLAAHGQRLERTAQGYADVEATTTSGLAEAP
jgi:hypothetical protein